MMKKLQLLLVLVSILALPAALWAAPPSVRVEPSNLKGPRPLQDQTAAAVVRDYLESWQSLTTALAHNSPALLDRDFTGTAKDKLTATMRSQARLGIHTRYHARSHDLRIVFYSPEGLSVQLIDNVVYDQQVLRQGKVLANQRVRARYIVILTPAEQRWRVRVFQAQSE